MMESNRNNKVTEKREKNIINQESQKDALLLLRPYEGSKSAIMCAVVPPFVVPS